MYIKEFKRSVYLTIVHMWDKKFNFILKNPIGNVPNDVVLENDDANTNHNGNDDLTTATVASRSGHKLFQNFSSALDESMKNRDRAFNGLLDNIRYRMISNFGKGKSPEDDLFSVKPRYRRQFSNQMTRLLYSRVK